MRDGVVRRPKRPPAHQRHLRRQLVGHRVDAGDVERLLHGHGRQDARQRPRQQRLSRPRWADHQHVVLPGSRHLESALDMLLTLDLAHVGLHFDRGLVRRDVGRRRDAPGPVDMREELGQRGYRQHLQVRDQGRFGSVHLRYEDALIAHLPRRSRHRQHPAHMPHAAVQRKLPHHQRAFPAVGRQLTGRDQDPQRDRQVVGRTFLAHGRRRQVDDQRLAREVQPRVFDG